jgi:AcrR family transcriptional regulator
MGRDRSLTLLRSRSRTGVVGAARGAREIAGKTSVEAGEPAPGAEREGAARHILDAAARLLRHRGYEAATTRAIAQEVGIKAGSIYHHFGSKDEIVEAVMNDGVRFVREAVATALAALAPDASPRDRLETALRAHLLSSLEHSDYTSASIRAFAFMPSSIRARCTAERQKYEELWRDIASDLLGQYGGNRDISPDALRLMLLGAVNWAGEWYRPGPLSINKIARDFACSILGGN